MKNETRLLDERIELEQELIEESNGLAELAYAFRITGNREVYERLIYSSRRIAKVAKESARISSEELNQRIGELQQSGAAILTACLHTGEKLKKENNV